MVLIGVRNISAMIKPNNVAMGVNIMDTLKGADLGDVPVIPDYIHETYAAIEETLTGVLDAEQFRLVSEVTMQSHLESFVQ